MKKPFLQRVAEESAALTEARGQFYGDPKENHAGIAQMWAPLLEPHWRAIREMEPVPPHVVALLMAGLKLNRMRRVYHEDNYTDAAQYLEFAEGWQVDEPPKPQPRRHRFYVAGPYTANTEDGVQANVRAAATAAAGLMQMGHLAHCPHTATHTVAQMMGDTGQYYEQWMDLDLGLIRDWATALFFIAPSPGADRELAFAKKIGIPVFHTLGEVEDLRDVEIR